MQGWKKKAFLFLVSQGVTLFGSSLVQFAIVWYVTLETSSGIWVSALTICSFVPQFLISMVAGVWADRYPRKLLIILSDTIIAVATLVLALLIPHFEKQQTLFIALLLTSIVRSLGSGVQMPAVSAMIPQLVPEDQLMRFNGLHATFQSLVQFAAPAAAGAVLTFSTLRNSLFVDIASAVVGITLLSFLAIPTPLKKQNPVQSSVAAEMHLGMRYVFQNRFLRSLLLSFGLFIFLSVPAGFLATLFVTRTYAESYLYMTIVEVVGFAGMAAGGLLMSTWTGFKDKMKTLLVGMAWFGVLAIGMGAIESFVVYLCLMAVYGIALTMVQTAMITLLQERTEPTMQGRVFGFQNLMFSGSLPLGMAVFGPLSDVFSMRYLMIGTGAALLLLVFKLKLSTNVNRHPHQP